VTGKPFFNHAVWRTRHESVPITSNFSGLGGRFRGRTPVDKRSRFVCGVGGAEAGGRDSNGNWLRAGRMLFLPCLATLASTTSRNRLKRTGEEEGCVPSGQGKPLGSGGDWHRLRPDAALPGLANRRLEL